MNSKGLVVFYIFQGLIHIFKDDFINFQDKSSTKGTFIKFQEFSRIKVKFKDFSRSVRTLLPGVTSYDKVAFFGLLKCFFFQSIIFKSC